jgi:peptide/nickel transport system substrate-binding protein
LKSVDDVVFSIGEIWRKHAQPEAMVDVTRIEAAANDTVVVHYNRPVPPFSFGSLLTHGAAFIVPRHTDVGALGDAPIGTGPFRLKEWVRGSHVEYARNERYWQKGLPYLDALAIRFIRDPAGRAAAVEAGEVQLGVFNALPPVEAKRLAATGKFVVSSRGYEEPVWATTLECNVRREITGKREVRQALFHGINRGFIARSIFHGQARAGTGPIFAPNKAFYGADIHRFDFSRTKAEELLDAAGYKKDKDGKRFTLDLVAAGWLPENAKVGGYLKQSLAEIGVAVNLMVTDRRETLRRIHTDYDFDLAVSNQVNPAEPVPWTTRYYASGGIVKGLPFHNASGYANPALDALVDRIKTEIDVLKRRDLVGEFQKIVTEDAPLLPLVEHAPVTVAGERIRNHSGDPNFPAASWADLWVASDP